MSEAWQFVAAAGVGVIVIVLWIFFIYLPRWTSEGGNKSSAADTREDVSGRDDLS